MGRNTWLQPEKGNTLAARLLVWVALHLGYRVTALLRWPATLYYATLYPPVRKASFQYLTYLHEAGLSPRRPHWGMVLAHINAYSTNILDRIYLLSGRFPAGKITVTGQEHLRDALAMQKGCIIMGAHIGSFDALRQFGVETPIRFRLLMYRRFLGAASRVIEALAPGFSDNIIELGEPDSMVATFKALKANEAIGILADRAHDDGRSLPVSFLGHEARLPAGPFQLARLTGAPVVFVSAIRQENGCYHVACHPLADTLSGEAVSSRAEALPAMQAYARWMEGLCRQSPYAWFNFFDFWEEGR